MKRLKGALTISRMQGSHELLEPIRIEIVDQNSRCILVRADLSFEGLAKAITGQAYIDCSLDYNDSGVIGKFHEHKTIVVPFDPLAGPYKEREARAAAALVPHEVDGWRGDVQDMLNHHRCIGDKQQSVTFHRYVERNPDEQPNKIPSSAVVRPQAEVDSPPNFGSDEKAPVLAQRAGRKKPSI